MPKVIRANDVQVDWKEAQRIAARTARWAVTMAQVRIRRVAARTRWQLVTFSGPRGGESVGVVDLLAVRKDHGTPSETMKRGDALQMILIQVKGGSAAMPTAEDGMRLRAVPKRHGAKEVLLGVRKAGSQVQFYTLRSRHSLSGDDWTEVADLDTIFH